MHSILIRRYIQLAFLCLCTGVVMQANAQITGFEPGTAIPQFGLIATVDGDMPIDKNTEFKIAFDAAKESNKNEINRTLNSAARFINMHVEAGVPATNISLAIVFHGPAALDLKKGSSSETAISILLEHGVQIFLCGQTAAARNVNKEDLVPGVQVALSAMTAHALLQQSGYTLNPF